MKTSRTFFINVGLSLLILLALVASTQLLLPTRKLRPQTSPQSETQTNFSAPQQTQSLTIPSAPTVTPLPSPQSAILTKDTFFQLGGFKILVPASTAYATEYDEELIKVITSKIDSEKPEDHQCVDISNIHTLFYKVVIPNKDKSISPVFYWRSWSQDQLRFKSDSYQEDFQKRIANIEELFELADGNLNIDQSKEIDLGHFLACGGGWFVPVYKQNIVNTGLDKVMYLEVNSGNGDPFDAPTKHLYIKHNNNWLIASHYRGYEDSPEMRSNLNKCFEQESRPDNTLQNGIKCAAKVWEKHRTSASVETWVKEVLSQIN